MAGVVDFDPEKWSRSIGAEPPEPAKVAKAAKAEPTLATLAALAAPSLPLLPEALRRGLQHLRAMNRPHMAEPGSWPGIVRDCLRLASEGWAQQALGLGWDPLHLWGCSPDPGGNSDHEGLAVWLSSRRIILLDDRSCLVSDGPSAMSIFSRRPMGGAVLTWELASRPMKPTK